MIRYNLSEGADCPVWLLRLDDNFHGRLLAMAERWHYTDEELEAVLSSAREDPAMWKKIIRQDEDQAA